MAVVVGVGTCRWGGGREREALGMTVEDLRGCQDRRFLGPSRLSSPLVSVLTRLQQMLGLFSVRMVALAFFFAVLAPTSGHKERNLRLDLFEQESPVHPTRDASQARACEKGPERKAWPHWVGRVGR